MKKIWFAPCNLSLITKALLLASAALLMGICNTAMAVTVSAYPSTCASVTGIGSVAWTNPTRAVSSNNSYATASVDGSITRFLECTGYGFAIPAGAIINGVTVNVQRASSSTANGGITDAAMRLVKAGTIGSTDLSTGTIYPTTDTTEAHGSATELWGDTWTATDINNANFGAAFAATKASNVGAAQTVSVDFIQIVVDYTLPPSVSSINLASTDPTAPATAVAWTVVFSTSVAGVDATDFTLAPAGGVTGATITSVTGAGTTWTVNANTGSGTGTLGLNLVDNDSIVGGGLKLGGTGTTGIGDGSFTGQVYTIPAPFCSPPSNIPAGVTVTCQCDTFGRATLNPSTIFGSDWQVSTSDATGILPSIVNSGYLRLTNNTGNNAKVATVPGIFPASGNYISVEFQHYAYNGSGADGIAVTLSDYSVAAVPGAYGGSLGYAQETAIHDGFAGGWLGVGLDEYGNYQYNTEGRLGGPGFTVQSVGARGSGSGQTGYRWLGGTSSLTPNIDNRTSTTPSRGYYYQVIVDARSEPTGTSIAVNRDTGSGYAPLITIPNVYTAATAQGFTQAPVPANWQISFTGSTGGSTNIHEIGGLRICAQSIQPPPVVTAGPFNAIDEAYGTPQLPVQDYLTSGGAGHIYTKLVGVPFKLDVAVLSSGQLVTNYAAASSKTVTVNLVDNSDGKCILNSTNASYCDSTCRSKTAVGSQTVTFTSGATDKGQKQSPSFTINSAYQNLVAVISDSTTTACSTDSFSVRPLSIASAVSSNATNTGTAGTPIFNAGSGIFSLTATTTGVAGNPSGYNGVIQTNPVPFSPATVNGILAGTFTTVTPSTPSTTETGSTFTYSEVGAFQLLGYTPDATCTVNGVSQTATQCNIVTRGAYDNAWTGVDSPAIQGDCVSGSYSNTKDTNGKYGCNFGLLPNPISPFVWAFGRFVPDHFDTVVKYDTVSKVFMPCPTGISPTCPASGDLVYGNGFAYSGQPFTTQVTARNSAGALTLNYDSAKTLSKTVTLSAYNAAGGAVANPPGGNGGMTLNSVPSTAFSAGLATTTNTPTYTFTTRPTAPTDIFMRAGDTDNVTSLRGGSSVEGGIKVVSGRIRISNALGSELLPLSIAVTAQYWKDAASGWVTSSTDSVSSFVVATPAATSAVNFGNFQKNLTTVLVGSSPKTVTLLSGAGGFSLTAGTNKNGSVDMSIPALTGVNCLVVPTPLGCYLPSNTARAIFGVYKGANEFIYLRENY